MEKPLNGDLVDFPRVGGEGGGRGRIGPRGPNLGTHLPTSSAYPFIAVFWVGVGWKTMMGSDEEKRDFGYYLAECFNELVESMQED